MSVDHPADSSLTLGLQRVDRLLQHAERYAMLGLTLLLVVLFGFLPATRDVFLTTANLKLTVGNQSVLMIVALAALIPLVAGQYDFSVGATMGLASIYAASSFSNSGSLIAAICITLGAGLGIGIVNGLLITRARVNSIIATLGTATIIHGIVNWKTGGQSIVEGIPASVTDFGSGTSAGVPNTLYVAIGAALATFYLLEHTPYGRYLYALGSNQPAAKLVGLNVARLTMSTFLASGVLAGAAGLLQITRSGAGNPQVGDNFTLPAIAAAFLSVAAIKPGRFNVWGTLVAILFLATLNSGLYLMGASSYVNDFANGVALIVGVSLASFLGRRRALE